MYSKFKTSLSITLTLMMALGVWLTPTPRAAAQLTVDPEFDPSILISDKAFSDPDTFDSAAGIQKFLEDKKSVLANTSPSFIAMLKEPDTLTKVGLEDPRPNLNKNRTAAELIYDVSTKHGLNPQVILVKLEKEQSLITGSFSGDTLQRRLDRALGFGCPDVGGCGDIFLSFYRQLYGTFDAGGSRWLGAVASLMRSFNTTGGRGPMVDAQGRVFGQPLVRTSQVGDTIVLDNTMGSYGGISQTQSVKIGNKATAALYRYTPHVFNGNYNFWLFYSRWFKYADGTVIQRSGDPNYYVLDGDTKRPFSQFVATQRKLDISDAVTVSRSEFNSYETASPMPPLDDTLLKGDHDGAVYLVQDGILRPISYPIFVQRKYSFANVVTIAKDEFESYETGKFLPPSNGTLIMAQGEGTVYQVDGDLRRPISYEVFVAHKFSFGNVLVLNKDEMNVFEDGPFVLPPDGIAINLKNDFGVYWFRDGVKRYVSAFVYEQRGVNTFPHLALGADEFEAIPKGTPFPPRDGTVIKGDSSEAIYLMQDGLKKLLTPTSYARLRNPRPTILPQSDVDAYEAGEIIAQ